MILRTNLAGRIAFFALLLCFPFFAAGQNGEQIVVTADGLTEDKTIALDKAVWKYQSGDDAAWAAKDFDDANWEQIRNTRLNPEELPASGWKGRAWFRLHFKVDETAADKTLALSARQVGASEVYLDGRLLARFGKILEDKEIEYNPNTMPIPFKVDRAGEHVLAVRYSLLAMSDLSRGGADWLVRSGTRPGFDFALRDATDLPRTIHQYANATSMRPGVFFIGVLLSLAFLHFLLFLHYRAERANLFYSFYAAAFAVNLVCGNLLAFGTQSALTRVVVALIASLTSSLSFIALLAFLHVAFRRKFGVLFWLLTLVWVVNIVLNFIYLNNLSQLRLVSSIGTFGTISYSIYLLVKATIDKQPGAWILMVGMQLFAVGMLSVLFRRANWVNLPPDVYFFGEVLLLLGVPVAVSVYLARNFARTNRDLQKQLVEVQRLSEQQIESERQAAELRAENERRAKELEEARQLQLSMLPKKLPELPNLEIAAYMKPATEVGGDYYDFYVGKDGTLTAVIGDATGHGLKAGSVVTATKSLFNAFAEEPNIGRIFGQTSKALKAMNLRGLFMAMAMLKIRENRVIMSVAGMPPTLIYRAATGEIEEIAIRAMPLGSIANFAYQEREFTLASGDVLVLMSDGFPEMFNAAGEMLADDEAKKVLAENAHLSAQEIINRFVKVGENWAGTRPPDDDVTFVVLKVKQGFSL